MTPKEKAEELVNTYFHIIDNAHPLTDIMISAKQCALIAVDEIIKLPIAIGIDDLITYWEEVKQEIEQL
jgi:hypothetical protein